MTELDFFLINFSPWIMTDSKLGMIIWTQDNNSLTEENGWWLQEKNDRTHQFENVIIFLLNSKIGCSDVDDIVMLMT